MKKLFILLLPLCLFVESVYAEDIPAVETMDIGTVGYINASGIDFNSLPNLEADDLLYSLDTGDKVIIKGAPVASTVDVCESSFYKVSFYWETYNQKTYEGYVCGDNIITAIDLEAYETELSEFPESYKFPLALLLSAHPNWTFIADSIDFDFSYVVAKESVGGINSIQSTNPIFLAIDSETYYDPITNIYSQVETGGWYAANSETIAYYMDPRNFLDEYHVFMFENFEYNSKIHTIDVVESVLENTALFDYSNLFMDAAIDPINNISPVLLAARSKQEVVVGEGLSDSATGSSGVYNFFNIGAYSSAENPVAAALLYATNHNWTTPELAINGGAKFLATYYVNAGQNTLYYQKFNVSSSKDNLFSNQYMANIQAPKSEAESTFYAYKEKLMVDSSFDFVIPVYTNMPDESRLPTEVDQEAIDELIALKKPDLSLLGIPDIIAEAGFRLNGETISNFMVNSTVASVESKFNIADETVVIKRGSAILKDDDIVSTGDTLIITKNDDEVSLDVIVYGDTSGDGIINVLDLLKVQKHILESSSLSGNYIESADVNKDLKIDVLDLLKIQKDILGVNKIDQ